MSIQRPDLEKLAPDVRAYIESLEAELAQLRQGDRKDRRAGVISPPPEPSEPPTTINVITVSGAGLAKRTPRHLYTRQRRGGMGIFDLETPEDDPPTFLTVADESQDLVLITDRARAFRLPVRQIPESPVNGRGQSIVSQLSFNPGERLALLLPDQGSTYVALLTQRGYVRWFAGHLFGDRLRSGTVLYEVDKFGPPVSTCWAPGEGDLFVATRFGRAIRFSARQVPVRGCLGIRLERDDVAVSVAAVQAEGSVFLLSSDGRGTVRLMSGFRRNKAPGAGGKIAMKTDHLVGAVAVGEADDVFIVSQLSKVIRFPAWEVPPKEGVVQGVNCMALRADETVTVAVSPP